MLRTFSRGCMACSLIQVQIFKQKLETRWGFLINLQEKNTIVKNFQELPSRPENPKNGNFQKTSITGILKNPLSQNAKKQKWKKSKITTQETKQFPKFWLSLKLHYRWVDKVFADTNWIRTQQRCLLDRQMPIKMLESLIFLYLVCNSASKHWSQFCPLGWSGIAASTKKDTC